jgi:hypothetical protein
VNTNMVADKVLPVTTAFEVKCDDWPAALSEALTRLCMQAEDTRRYLCYAHDTPIVAISQLFVSNSGSGKSVTLRTTYDKPKPGDGFYDELMRFHTFESVRGSLK